MSTGRTSYIICRIQCKMKLDSGQGLKPSKGPSEPGAFLPHPGQEDAALRADVGIGVDVDSCF